MQQRPTFWRDAPWFAVAVNKGIVDSNVAVSTIARTTHRTQIAVAAGFGSADAMSHAFVRLLGITPRHCRNQFLGPAAR
jgi:methylphosphotriester-DNA--protein-cysteine methyltransferase